MKTQISKNSHRPEKRYSGVYQQQGRMIVDSDLNEQTELTRQRLFAVLREIVGSGAGREGAYVVKQDGELRISPGRLYARGVFGEVAPDETVEPGESFFAFDQQADFPAPPPPPDSNYTVYADLWQRTVTSLEDRELVDPALHGADTCTRSRTMVQVKWRPGRIFFSENPFGPAHGDSRLTLTVRAGTVGADPCDPCAEEVAIDSRTGNYLFRVEVHDVEGFPEAPTGITLKWSRENGAEHHRVGTEPPEFKAGPWVYELFNETSESHLGVHFAPGFTPQRGELHDELPESVPSRFPYVRRWDGYAVLDRDGSGEWSLVEGRDMGVPLSTTAAADTHGQVSIGDHFEAHLESLTMKLELIAQPIVLDWFSPPRSFVVGDFWQAAVRETVHEPGQSVLDTAEPDGILHRYVTLASVDGEGDLDSLLRFFPPLTELSAGDVSYYPKDCPSELFTSLEHDTVQKALDRLCRIAAEHIGYDGQCDSGLFDGNQDTVKKALDRLCQLAAEHVAYGGSCDSGLFDGSQATVREALDRLCQIAAEHVGYTPHEECEDLEGVATVQGALDALCLRPTGGSVSRDIVQSDHGFRPGDAIYFDAEAGENGAYVKALADRPATTGLFLVSEVESGEELTLLQAGYLDLEEAYAPEPVPEERLLQPGQYYFVSADEAGTLTPDEPKMGISNPILYADSRTGGYVLPWRPSEPVSGGQSVQAYVDQLFVGTVNAFAMETPPEGWLECNGQAIGRRKFARLFERIGTRFGPGDGETTFNVPDLRGEFVRGWDHNRGLDRDRAFGTVQGDSFRSHRHTVSGWSPWPHDPMGQIWENGWGMIKYQGTSFGTSTVGGSETRPRNIALLFCIKY